MSHSDACSRRRFLCNTGLIGAAGCAASSTLAAQAPAKKTPSHKYEELLPEQFYEELARAPIAYFGVGAMEEHGLHMPLGTDPWQAYEVCLRAAAISGGIVFPLVPFGTAGLPGYSRSELRSGTKRLVPPSLWISRELCKDLYIELMESMAELGFKSCIAFGGHYPCDVLLQAIHKELGGKIGAMKFWGGGTVSILRDMLPQIEKEHPHSGGHGMMWETSAVVAMRPDCVDLPRAQRIEENPLDSQLKKQPKARIDCIAKANAELGNRILNEAAKRAAKLAQEMLSPAVSGESTKG